MQLYFSRGRTQSNRKSESALYINNCGIFSDVEENISVSRPRGREDYHLIFVARGEVKSNLGTAKSGDAIYYPAHAVQRYTYQALEGSLYYWIHFSGTDAATLAEGCDGSSILNCTAYATRIAELFAYVTNATAKDLPHEERYAQGLLRSIFALACAKERCRGAFDAAIELMQDLQSTHTTEQLARAVGMSEGHFIRSFKKELGKTPTEYRTDLQIGLAKNLLVGTSLKIKTVSALVGFQDPLYFSRVFKERVGTSPKKYRAMQ